jgi:exo-1,4-beta-D-glucosaminidase
VRIIQIGILLSISMMGVRAFGQAPANRIDLHTGWTLQSLSKVKDDGATISRVGYRTDGWYKITVPATVLAAQVASGEFPDPYFGMNLRKIPGMAYAIGALFAHKPIPPDSPYACSWWYRTEFASPAGNHKVALHFDGINNRANIWLNGKKIADAKDIAGAYRTYEFDITPDIAPHQSNVLAVEVFSQTQNDLGINWVDWNPTPPDKDMGLWQAVYLTTSGPVEIRYPTVETHLPNGDKSPAELSVLAELKNLTDQPVTGTFLAELPELGLAVKKSIALDGRETKSITLTPGEFPQLAVKNAQLWWPAQMGIPFLYRLHTSFTVSNTISDSATSRIGIREVTSEMTPKGARLYKVNGKPILIRGGGWAPDMLLRQNSVRLRNEFQYVQDMNLNTIRLEGKLEDDEFFNLADEKGILIMAGWCCCDLWEEWERWNGDQLAVATESLRSQSLRLRSHPSLLMWLNGSDGPPPANVEAAYLQVLQETQWPNPIESSASQTPAELTGTSGVKMTGPYDYVPPSYWYIDQQHGGAYGFNTETGPGPAIPTAGSLAKFIPADHLWPIDDIWNFHAGSGNFKNLNKFNSALTATYGEVTSPQDFQRKSQAMTYDAERAMFEAYSRNKYTSTGVIQWMLNNAWPSLIWHLYDYYLQPAGGYFGTKKANEPVHIQYSYDDRSIVVVNSTYHPVAGLEASARLTDVNLKEEFAQRVPVTIGPDAVKTVFLLPDPPAGSTNVHFLQLRLTDEKGALISTNFYWLSTKKPEFDWPKTTYVSTPITSYEDFTALASLPQVRLNVTSSLHSETSGDVVHVHVKNPSKTLALQVRLAIDSDNNGTEILPVLWQDNYISLMPGEERTLKAKLPDRHLAGSGPVISISGWNIQSETIAIGPTSQRKNSAINQVRFSP